MSYPGSPNKRKVIPFHVTPKFQFPSPQQAGRGRQPALPPEPEKRVLPNLPRWLPAIQLLAESGRETSLGVLTIVPEATLQGDRLSRRSTAGEPLIPVPGWCAAGSVTPPQQRARPCGRTRRCEGQRYASRCRLGTERPGDIVLATFSLRPKGDGPGTLRVRKLNVQTSCAVSCASPE